MTKESTNNPKNKWGNFICKKVELTPKRGKLISIEISQEIFKLANDHVPNNNVDKEYLFNDYQEASRMYRHWDQTKVTLFSILFSGVIIVMGITVNNFNTIPWYLISFLSTLILLLIWGWVFYQIRLETSANVIGIYLKSMEVHHFNRKINGKNFTHPMTRDILTRNQIPEANDIYAAICCVFSGIALILPILKIWPILPLPFLENLPEWANGVAYFLLVVGIICGFWRFYNWLRKGQPSEASVRDQSFDLPSIKYKVKP